MTDDDRQLLRDLRKMTDACGSFCMGVLENNLSRDDQLALSDWTRDMSERIRKRALSTPIVIDGVIEGSAVLPTWQPGEALYPAGETGGRDIGRTV